MELFFGPDLTISCHLDHFGFPDAVLFPKLIQELMAHIKRPFFCLKMLMSVIFFWVQFKMEKREKLGQ